MNKYRLIGAALIATVFATIAYSQQSNIGGMAARLRLTSLGVGATPPAAGNITASGTITGASIAGAGSALTALNASNLSSGTVPDARFPATLPAASGANLTSLNASNLSSGTVATARLPWRIAHARVSSAGALQAGSSGVTSTARNALGDYTVNVTAAGFTSIPTCTMTTQTTNVASEGSASTTSINVFVTSSTTAANLDRSFTVICLGT